MKKITLIAISGLLAAGFTSSAYAQTPAVQDCSEAHASFASAMELFRSAFFEREDADGSAESVMADQVLPSAEQMYQVCPANVAAAVKSGVDKTQASLNDPSRTKIVACDKALITYKGSLNKFDNQSLSGGYNAYRILLDRNVNPSAQAAIDACPQMPELARQARLEIAERQTRLNQMENIDNARATMSENIATSNAEFSDSFNDNE